MISCYSKWVLFFLLPFCCYSQIDEVLVDPSITFSFQQGSRWGFNTILNQRSVIYEEGQALHVQAAQFATYEVGFYSQLGMGVMYREIFDDDRPEELRTTQQYVFARKYNALKIAHRGRWDQRWRADRLTHRWRYRLSSSLPLNGLRTDSSEFYLTGSWETLFIAENGTTPAFDQRFAIGLGQQLNENIKLQLVTTYRIEDFTKTSERLLFLELGLYYSFN
ncbi:hypothetical protein BST97_09765 [Nonlabens spongiae]|uniref:DUF2490 domain-containing protein n=1 Tax=Nonlabens spongiae TaxID=331648 RepID=A0A1W6MKW0_9FLAO|nr:DUF2490 domain-containing protein [Nonlabens spongiae]ARN78254.1 hypothetical protein BST97_09765 [Nonlabens spongiae]